MEDYSIMMHLDVDDVHAIRRALDSNHHLAEAVNAISDSMQEISNASSSVYHDGLMAWLTEYERPVASACHVCISSLETLRDEQVAHQILIALFMFRY